MLKLLFKKTYAVSKALFEKRKRFTLYQSYFLKKQNAIRCIEATFQSNSAQLCSVAVYTQGGLFIGSESDPFLLSLYIQIRDLNKDPYPGVQN